MQGIRTPFESLKPLAIVGTVFLSPGEFVIVFCDVGPTAAAAEAFSDGIIFFSEKADRGLIVSKDKSVKS